jgi:hypothetical protein
MLDIVKRIIELQTEWSSDNTPAMQERGDLVRNKLPAAFRRFTPQFSAILNVGEADVGIVGRDGSGRKTAIPWVRIFSRDRSPNPQTGWYVVLLFHSEGQKLYLCVSHGSTDWTGGEFKPKPAQEVAPLMQWASTLLEPFFKFHPHLQSKISLGDRGKLGGPYEASTPVAKLYDVSNLPAEDEFERDLMLFAEMLHRIYEQDDLGRLPDSEASEFGKAQEEFKIAAEGTRSRGGQGFGLTTLERRAVEEHAMKLAENHLTNEGYNCKITSAYEPFDILASNSMEKFVVEVKGTTSTGAHIILTANEVKIHRERSPNNALYVVHSIQLTRESAGVSPVAKGGVLVISKPWDIDQHEMKALAYQVKL